MTEEELAVKYGRRKTFQNNDNTKNDETSSDFSKDKDENNITNNSYTKKAQADKEQIAKEKEIKANIKDVISKYGDGNWQDLTNTTTNKVKIRNRQNTKIGQFIKTVLVLCILVIVSCIVISFMVKPQIDFESEQIIEQINKAEDLYYAKVKKYHYFARTDYDNTLGVVLNDYKYFTSYEVSRDEKTGNYAVKLYGATNAFTITYCVIKSWLENK